MPTIHDGNLVERLTNQRVFGPLDWDEKAGTVVMYLNSERVTFDIDDLRTPEGEQVAFVER